MGAVYLGNTVPRIGGTGSISEPLCDSGEIVETGGILADFAVIINDMSMASSGIFEGDIVLFTRKKSSTSERIVASIVSDGFGGGELLVRYYVNNKKRGCALCAASIGYDDIKFNQSCNIIGCFAGLIRDSEPSMHQIDSFSAVTERLGRKWAAIAADAEAAGLDESDIQGMIKMLKKVKSEK